MEEQTGRENRRDTRVRRVQPVRFRAAGTADTPTGKTVSANVSRSGLLLVSRTDTFPASGTWVDLVPKSSPGAVWEGGDISGRIVYTRSSPKNTLSFAGVEFLHGLDEQSARSFGLVSGEDAIHNALKTLKELEVACRTGRAPETGSAESLPSNGAQSRERMDAAFDLARKQFMSAMESFLHSWAETTVMENVTEFHEVSRRKGAAGLAALKSDLRALLAAYPGMMNAMLSTEERRWHGSGSNSGSRDTTRYYDAENESPAPWIANVSRNLMGATGDLLARHGYDLGRQRRLWSERPGEASGFKYRGRLVLPEDLTVALKQLSELSTQKPSIAADSTASEDARGRMDALRLWDES